MNITRLGTILLASVLAPAAHLSAQPAHAALADPVATDDMKYCVSVYVVTQNPNCLPPPKPSKDYRGEPVAVSDIKKVTGFEGIVYVNVLKNDAIQKKSKSRVEIVSQRPKWNGVYAFVIDNKIRLRFEFETMSPTGAVIGYRVLDAKGRASNTTYLEAKTCFACGQTRQPVTD